MGSVRINQKEEPVSEVWLYLVAGCEEVNDYFTGMSAAISVNIFGASSFERIFTFDTTNL